MYPMVLRMTVTENLVVVIKLVAKKLSNSYQKKWVWFQKGFEGYKFYKRFINMTVTKILEIVTKIIKKKLSYSYQKGFSFKKVF